MVYSIKKLKVPRTKRTKFELKEELDLEGFLMPSRSKKFAVDGMMLHDIRIMSKKLGHPIVSKKVKRMYKKLLMILTELLVTDDDSGQTYREALNQIERFRRQIKNKYRHFLERKELETMSKQLKLLQMEAKNRLFEMQMSYDYMNVSGKSR